ncbi:MAG: leucine-rich repeat domain-containing protein, partial [Bacteroidaceae bacterium]|nr:leucine-rich repeat domain-containing protein [Bacteroidaceae bacterium]
KSVTLSKRLAHLGEDAFWNCSNLEEIVCKSEVPPATLYIDKGAIDRLGGVFTMLTSRTVSYMFQKVVRRRTELLNCGRISIS